MVSSADGAATVDGRSGGLGGSADRAVFSVLRSLADVILVGAGTARTSSTARCRLAEAWPPLRAGRPPAPPIAVVTRAGCRPGPGWPAAGHAHPDRPGRSCSPPRRRPRACGRRRPGVAHVIVAGPDRVHAGRDHRRAGRARLRPGADRGRPALLGQIAAAGLLDELCLTISPMLAGGWARPHRDRPPPAGARTASTGLPAQPRLADLRLAHVLEEDGHLLCRYLRTKRTDRRAATCPARNRSRHGIAPPRSTRAPPGGGPRHQPDVRARSAHHAVPRYRLPAARDAARTPPCRWCGTS